MLKISNTGNVPLPSIWANGSVKGSHWCFYVDATNTLIRGGDQVDLLKKVTQHYQSNDLPLPVNLPEIIEDGICNASTTPCHFVEGSQDNTKDGHLRRVMRFGHCVWLITKAKLLRGNPFVEQPEADRRATICAECPANGEAPTCPGCVNFISDVNHSLGKRETPYDDQLETCNVCGCSNSVSVWIDAGILKRCSKADYKKINPKCWKEE